MYDVRNIQHINTYFALKTEAPYHLETLVTTKYLSHPIITYSSNQTRIYTLSQSAQDAGPINIGFSAVCSLYRV